MWCFPNSILHRDARARGIKDRGRSLGGDLVEDHAPAFRNGFPLGEIVDEGEELLQALALDHPVQRARPRLLIRNKHIALASYRFEIARMSWILLNLAAQPGNLNINCPLLI